MFSDRKVNTGFLRQLVNTVNAMTQQILASFHRRKQVNTKAHVEKQMILKGRTSPDIETHDKAYNTERALNLLAGQ